MGIASHSGCIVERNKLNRRKTVAGKEEDDIR